MILNVNPPRFLKTIPPRWIHLSLLLAILVLGSGLRFWNLADKPLWLDEVLTTLFSSGHGFLDVPREGWFSTSQLPHVFEVSPTSCRAIAQTVATDSNHPPLFFCLMHGWLRWLHPSWLGLPWAVRSLPAVLGVASIASMYALGRQVANLQTGLVAALVMAVSPFAVYLSQEARHYTLPMLVLIGALMALVAMQRDLAQQRRRPLVWLLWVGLNVLGLYIHYFVVFAVIAQVGAIALWWGWENWQRRRWDVWGWGSLTLAIAGIGLGYLPWWPTFWLHMNRPEAGWLTLDDPDWGDRLTLILQTVMGWVLMVVALPVEGQPLGWAIPSGLVMVGLFGWIVAHLGRMIILKRYRSLPFLPAVALLLLVTLGILIQFLVLIFILNKDITVAPRYNFVYYPSLCLLLSIGLMVPSPARPDFRPPASSLAGGLAQITVWQRRYRPLWGAVLAGIISSGLICAGLVFQKPYYPDRVAQTMYPSPDRPLLVMMAYRSLQDVALGLSFAIAVEAQAESYASVPLPNRPPSPSPPPDILFRFIERSGNYRQVWRQLTDQPIAVGAPMDLWAIASPGMDPEDFPPRLRLSTEAGDRTLCTVVPDAFYKIGYPYQGYRCDR